jgi:hypothetical protein
MLNTARLDDAGRVTELSYEPQILVGVTPRILADVLTAALQAKGLVVMSSEDGLRPPVRHVSVALVSGALPGDVIADTVLVLDPSGTRLVLDREGDELELAVDAELSAVIDLLDDLLPGGRVLG